MNADQPPADVETLLLEFLRERDAPCPLCGYNLRNLSASTCPECREPLTLSVGFFKPRFGWFIATIIPGCFSGIAASLLLIPLVVSQFTPNPGAPWPIWALDTFGWLSALSAFVLVRFRYTFIRQPQETQRVWALVAWAIHVAAFVAFVGISLLQ